MNLLLKDWWKKKDKLKWEDWFKISQYRILSEEFMELAADYLDWHTICGVHQLSELFMERHIDKIKWYGVCFNQKMSEQFIRKHWREISTFIINLLRGQKLEMNFLREITPFLNANDWKELSYYQELDVNFLREFSDSIQWDMIYKRYPYPVKSEFYQQIQTAIGKV